MFKKQSEEALREIESNMNFEKEVSSFMGVESSRNSSLFFVYIKSITTITQMDLIDEVDYHCCIFCDKIFPADYELLMHVNEVHQNVMDLNSFVDDEEIIDEYLETINNKSPHEKVMQYIISTDVIFMTLTISYYSMILLLIFNAIIFLFNIRDLDKFSLFFFS